MKLSDYRGEDAIELLADMLESVTAIMADEKIRDMVKKDEKKTKIVAYLLKSHKKEILEIMARIDGEDPATYKPNFFVLPFKVMELLEDEDLQELFLSGSQNLAEKSSTDATENTEETEIR